MAIVSNDTVMWWMESLPGDPQTCVDRIRETMSEIPETSDWYRFGIRCADNLQMWISGKGEISKSSLLLGGGNTKLGAQIVTFSAAPLSLDLCPGASELCLKKCYSKRSHRYPAPVFRQITSTVALKLEPGREQIRAAIAKLKTGATVRLYVDGDCTDVHDVFFWLEAARSRPDVNFYSYSKAFHLFLSVDNNGKLPGGWPDNWLVNASSHSRFAGTEVEARFRALPVARAGFNMVSVKLPKHKAGVRRTRKALELIREAGREALRTDKVFACPSACGNCLPKGEQACGSARMNGVEIVEAIS